MEFVIIAVWMGLATATARKPWHPLLAALGWAVVCVLLNLWLVAEAGGGRSNSVAVFVVQLGFALLAWLILAIVFYFISALRAASRP